MPEFATESVVFATLLSGAAAKMLFGMMTWRNRQQKMTKVGTVTQLNCYPVKSCRGIKVEEGVCTSLGLQINGNVTDRHWMVARSNGDFVSQRQIPKMALIRAEVDGEVLKINAEGMPTLSVPVSTVTDRSKVIRCRVWNERLEGLDCGDDAAYWFSTVLGIQGLRLLYSASDIVRQDLRHKQEPWDIPTVAGDQSAFSDFAPYLVATEESLEAVNERLEEKVTMERFRPNIVISSGSIPFEEDKWSDIQIGESATIRMLDPCARCVMTTVNPETGVKESKEPLETIKSFRTFPAYNNGAMFGVNATVDIEGLVRVGDPVYAIMK